MSNKICIVLIGGPCSGKSSIGKLTASLLDAEYISSGDIARNMAKYDEQIGADLSAGKMAPEDMMRKHISNKIYNSMKLNDKDIVILDGFPRFGEQAEWLRNELPANIDIHYVLIDAPLSVIAERSAHRNREDDNSIERRLKYYNDITYKQLSKYIEYVIDTQYMFPDECSMLLSKYIEEVMNDVKNC